MRFFNLCTWTFFKKSSFPMLLKQNGGRYWDWTSDLFRVKEAFFHWTNRPHVLFYFVNGGGTRIRTEDEGFAVLCLPTWRCRHIFFKRWSGKRDLNPRPSPWQGDALPLSYFRKNKQSMVPRPRIELGTRGFSVHCSTNWAISANKTHPINLANRNGGVDEIWTRDLLRDRQAC